MKSYWYKFHIKECPVCGREYSYKQRIYNLPKPKDISLRTEHSEFYDWCEI